MKVEFQKYIDLKFIYELPEIIIEQRTSINPKTYTGPGAVEQDEDGNLILKMYSKSSESTKDLFKNESKPGRLIKDSDYYKIIAKDMYGSTWNSNKVRIDKHYGQGGKFLIIYAKLNQIFCEANLYELESRSTLILNINKDLQLPVAPFFEIQEIKEKEFYKNVRVFCATKVRDYQIIVYKQSNWIEVNISSKISDLPKNIDLRICEALQLITYTKLNWFFYEKFEGKKNYQKLNNINSYNIIKGFTPPFDINSTYSEQIWKIFKLYLDYILDYPIPDKYHPISSLLNLIIQAEKLPIETRFQTICICVESILKSEFDLKIDADSKLIENRSNIIKFIVENVDEKYKDRLQGLLGQLSNVRSVDKLYKLATDRLIEERLIKDWEDLRHPTIHGERIQSDRLQEYLDKYYSTLTLFYQLIFLKIGYTGRFTDYSSPNWPLRDFQNTL